MAPSLAFYSTGKLTDVGVIVHCLREEVNSIHGPIQFQGGVYLKVLRA